MAGPWDDRPPFEGSIEPHVPIGQQIETEQGREVRETPGQVEDSKGSDPVVSPSRNIEAQFDEWATRLHGISRESLYLAKQVTNS